MVSGRRGRTLAARIRRGIAIIMAFAAGYIGLSLTPRINDLHRAGAIRGSGPDGQELETIHRRAELVGKVELVGGMALVVLHVLTLGARRPEEDDDEDAVAPLPPGPRE
jgi:hypothetical protein